MSVLRQTGTEETRVGTLATSMLNFTRTASRRARDCAHAQYVLTTAHALLFHARFATAHACFQCMSAQCRAYNNGVAGFRGPSEFSLCSAGMLLHKKTRLLWTKSGTHQTASESKGSSFACTSIII